MEYHVRVIEDEAGFAQIEPGWTRLLGEGPAASVFASAQWNGAWWQHFGAGKHLYILAVADPAGALIGVAPLMLRTVGPLRKLEFIGTGLSDAGDFVLHPAHAAAATEAIFDALLARHRDWDLADLDEIPPFAALRPGGETVKPRGLQSLQLPRSDSPAIALPAAWEEYTRGLGRKARYHLEAYTRRFVAETGAGFRLLTGAAEVPAGVAGFYRLHLARWATKADELNPEHRAPTFVPFLEDLCRRCAAQGWLRLAELRVGGTPIASWISFRVGRRWSGYMTGFDPAWSGWRPGKILHGFVVRQAIAEGVQDFEFGRGAEAYKYELGAVSRQSTRLVLAHGAPRSAAAFALTALRAGGRELVHRSATAKTVRPE